jgi:hypothetical protein
METVAEKTKSNEKEHMKDTVYSPYKMRVDYKEKKIIIEYNKSFLSSSAEIYTCRLQKLTELIDWNIRNSFRRNKITTKNQVL